MSYDAAGNVMQDAFNTYTYDSQNQMISSLSRSSGSLTCYFYDAFGRRVQKDTGATSCGYPFVGGTSLYYVYDTAGNVIDEVSAPSGGTGNWTRQEIYAAGRHLATFNAAAGQAYWDFTDWLGTERVRVNAVTGAVAETCTSLPWGDNLQCTGTDQSPLHFTGKQRDSESGNDYFGARYNSSALGRFLSPDPDNAGANVTNPQSWDMYNYAVNNPLVFTDPTGLDCVYFNDAGDAAESIDHNSNSDECGQNGGDWVNGTTSLSQISYNQNSDTFDIKSSNWLYNFDTTTSAPGSQTMANNNGVPCYGNCDIENGYSQSFRFPNVTSQLGLSISITGFGVTLSGFGGLATDSQGHLATYYGGGIGVGLGAGLSGGVQGAASNGNTVCALGGPFINVSGTAGYELAGTADYFQGEGDAPGGLVQGGGATFGGGAAAAASIQVTGTKVSPFANHSCKNGKLR